MAEFIKPIIHAFLICDTIIIDSLTGKKSLIGAFTHLWARTFPCQHPQVGVYFSLTDAEGQYAFDIQLMYLDKDQIVGKGSLPPINIVRRLATHDFGVNIPTFRLRVAMNSASMPMGLSSPKKIFTSFSRSPLSHNNSLFISISHLNTRAAGSSSP